MFGAIGYDAAGRGQLPPQDWHPSSAAPVVDAIANVDNIDNGIIVDGISVDDDHNNNDKDDGCKKTIGDGGGGTLALAFGGGGGDTIDDTGFTTFTNIVYGTVLPRLAAAALAAAAPLAGVGRSNSDGGSSGAKTGSGTSPNSYYQMQRNGLYVAGTGMWQDKVLRRAKLWSHAPQRCLCHQRIDLDNVHNNKEHRRSSSVVGGEGWCFPGAEDGSTSCRIGCGCVGNSTLSSLTHKQAWLPGGLNLMNLL
jgi:hypothetical protein